MLDDGSGPVMREIAIGNGYSQIDLIGETRLLENSDTRVTEAGDTRFLETIGDSSLDIGIITSTYESTVISNFVNEISTTITYMAVGTGTTTFNVSSTDLTAEVYREANESSGVSGDSAFWNLYVETGEANGNTFGEIGANDASSSGNFYFLNLTTLFAKTSSNEAYYQIKTTAEVIQTNLN